MSSLDYFNIEIRPWIYEGSHGGQEKVYRYAVQYNGEKYSSEFVGDIPPFMDELTFLTRQVSTIKRQLEENEKERNEPSND